MKAVLGHKGLLSSIAANVGALFSRDLSRPAPRRFTSRRVAPARKAFLCGCFAWCCHVFSGEEMVLLEQTEFTLTFDKHLVDDVPYHLDAYIAVVEIPAGDVAKWEVNPVYGHLEWELTANGRRNVNYLPYPSNYGFIPQTIVSGASGGDNDPIDVLVLGPRTPRGTVQPVHILGGMRMMDNNEIDDKLIAAPFSGPFSNVRTIEDLLKRFPGVTEVIRLWFENYKSGSMAFHSYVDQNEAQLLIEEAHSQWLTSSLDHRGN